jgi:preprotein translocase subunit SecB
MDQTKEPGIHLVGVVVEHIRFDDIKAGSAKPKDLQFGITIERRPSDTTGEVVLRWSVRPVATAGEESSFSLDVAIAGRFQVDAANPNMPLEEFLRVNGPALLVPFAREAVANITSRSRHGVVYLPAVNVLSVVHRAEEAHKSLAAKGQA